MPTLSNSQKLEEKEALSNLFMRAASALTLKPDKNPIRKENHSPKK